MYYSQEDELPGGLIVIPDSLPPLDAPTPWTLTPEGLPELLKVFTTPVEPSWWEFKPTNPASILETVITSSVRDIARAEDAWFLELARTWSSG